MALTEEETDAVDGWSKSSDMSRFLPLVIFELAGVHIKKEKTMSKLWARQVGAIHSVPFFLLLLTFLISVTMVSTFWLGWAIWKVALLVVMAWLPILLLKTAEIYRRYQGLAFFFILVVTQGGHFLEHVAQMVQIHLLGLSGLQARGIFGMLDIEWVHFIWNSWVLIFVVLLLFLFRKNPWLWLMLVASTWHEMEHVYIMVVFLRTGHVGSPGLLAHGGAIAGGLPLTRPDLHFFYNLIEETLLLIAYVYQIKQLQSPHRRGSGELVAART